MVYFLLISIILYLVIRDIRMRRYRKKGHTMLKRISKKLDLNIKESKEHNRLFQILLNILTKEGEDNIEE